MRCHRVQRLLPDYIGEELSFKKREQIAQHLEECLACKAELAALQGVWDGLAQQALPQKGEEFWHGFTARVMREVGKRQPMPAEQKRPLFFPGWKVLLPVVGTAAAVIAMVIVLKGGPGPGQGPRVLPGERETVAEVARPFSVAPLAGEDEDLLGKGISLNGGNESAEGEVIGLKPAERAVLTEALSEVFGEEEQWEELDDRELERFEQLLSVRYSLS